MCVGWYRQRSVSLWERLGVTHRWWDEWDLAIEIFLNYAQYLGWLSSWFFRLGFVALVGVGAATEIWQQASSEDHQPRYQGFILRLGDAGQTIQADIT